MPTAPNGEPSRSPVRSGVQLPSEVARHIRHADDGGQLVTVRHQPIGPVAYLIEPDDEMAIEAIDIVGGHVITEWVHMRWGRVFSVPAGESVTEVCLHDTEEQARDYRQHCREAESDYIVALSRFDQPPQDDELQVGDGDEPQR